MCRLRPRATRRPHGFTLLDLTMGLALSITLAGLAVPRLTAGLDGVRARAAAWHMAAILRQARMTAAAQGVAAGLRFEATSRGVRYTGHVDGDGDGLRTDDIRRGIDPVDRPAERLSDRFRGVAFDLAVGVSPMGGGSTADPIRFGRADIVSFSPAGSATSGTVYLAAGHAQYAVRVLGVTGRTRVLRFIRAERRWQER